MKSPSVSADELSFCFSEAPRTTLQTVQRKQVTRTFGTHASFTRRMICWAIILAQIGAEFAAQIRWEGESGEFAAQIRCEGGSGESQLRSAGRGRDLVSHSSDPLGGRNS